MYDTSLMRGFQGLTNVVGNAESLFDPDGTAVNAIRQCFAFHELEHKEAGVIRLLEIIDCCDIRVIQRREYLRFTLKAADTICITGEFVGQDFDGHFPFEP